MNNAVLSPSSELLAGNTLNRLRRPVGAYISKNLRGAGHQMPKQHRYPVKAVIFRRHYQRLANTVPVERAVQQRLCGITIWILIRPVALPPKPDAMAL